EQLAQAMGLVHKAQGKAYWLRVRNVLCSDCIDTEQQIVMESPITDIPSPQFQLSAGTGVEEPVRSAGWRHGEPALAARAIRTISRPISSGERMKSIHPLAIALPGISGWTAVSGFWAMV